MADGKITAQIGCATCGTVLFDLRAVPADKPGVFENRTERREGVADDVSSTVCAGCGKPLSRVTG
jgi:hypothetical protein